MNLEINLDPVVLPSHDCLVTRDGEFRVFEAGKESIDKLKKYIDGRTKNFKFTGDNTMLLYTCEGFMFNLNVSELSKILTEKYGNTWRGKTTLNFANWNIVNIPQNYKGFKLEYNASFTQDEIWKTIGRHVYDYKLNFDRSLEKTFLSLQAASRIDRSHIFDHLFKNHYHNSTNIYRRHNEIYYGSLRKDYKVENHRNETYIEIFEGTSKLFDKENNLLYCWKDFGERLPKHFVNVVSETNFAENNCYWFTEKTVVPIMYGQPFITSTTTGYYPLLKNNFGLKTFSDFWDESFSEEPNHMERLKKFLSTLDYIAKKYDTVDKRKQALSDMQSILQHNRDTLLDIYVNRRFYECIGDYMN